MQTTLEVVAGSFQLLGLCHEQVGGNYATVADNVDLALIKDAAGDAAENKLFAFENNGMSGIRTSGETRNDIILRRKAVNHLTFAFVTKNNTQEGIYFSFCHSNKLVLRDKGTKKFSLIALHKGLFFPSG